MLVCVLVAAAGCAGVTGVFRLAGYAGLSAGAVFLCGLGAAVFLGCLVQVVDFVLQRRDDTRSHL